MGILKGSKKNSTKFYKIRLTNRNANVIILEHLKKRECAGIGRQARLRGVCGNAYGFKSRHSHQKTSSFDDVFFIY